MKCAILILIFMLQGCESPAEQMKRSNARRAAGDIDSIGEYCYQGTVYVIFFGGSHSTRAGASVKFVNGKPAACE